MAKLNISGLYDAAEKARLKSLQTAKKDSQARPKSTLSSIQSSYTDQVSQAQVNARISALGNEEKLAAAGLSFGAASAAPTTGYTETSRVRSNTALQSALSGLARQKAADQTQAQLQSSGEIAQAQQKAYEAISGIRIKKAQEKVNQYNKDREYTASQQAQKASQEAAAYQRALERWKTYGYVLPADEKILGVKAGTKTSAKTYNEAKLKLERWKTLVKL